MTQIERLRKILARVTYKPGWKFEVKSYPAGPLHAYGVTLIFYFTTLDVEDYRDGDPHTFKTVIGFERNWSNYDLGRMTDGEILQRVIQRQIKELELHEMDEWLKFDGQCVTDPHPEKKPLLTPA